MPDNYSTLQISRFDAVTPKFLAHLLQKPFAARASCAQYAWMIRLVSTQPNGAAHHSSEIREMRAGKPLHKRIARKMGPYSSAYTGRAGRNFGLVQLDGRTKRRVSSGMCGRNCRNT